MKPRGEDYKTIRIRGNKEDQKGLEEKESITGEELILLSKEDACGNVLSRVSSLRDAIENLHSHQIWEENLRNELVNTFEDDDGCWIPETSCCAFCSINEYCLHHECSWNNPYVTIPDVDFFCSTYVPDGSEMIALGTHKDDGYYTCGNIWGSHTFATELSVVVGNYLNTEEDLSHLFSKEKEHELTLLKNYLVPNIKVWDRLGSDQWLVSMKLEGLERTMSTPGDTEHSGNDFFKFNTNFLEYLKMPRKGLIYFFITNTLNIDDIENLLIQEEDERKKKGVLNKLPWEVVLGNFQNSQYSSQGEIGGQEDVLFQLKAKTSDTLYIWAKFRAGVSIPISCFKFSDFIDGDVSHSWSNDLNGKFYPFVKAVKDDIVEGSEFLNIKNIISEWDDMKWLDRDRHNVRLSFDFGNKYCIYIAKERTKDYGGTYEFMDDYCQPLEEIMIYNPEYHHFKSKTDALYGDAPYGIFCNIKSLPESIDFKRINLYDNEFLLIGKLKDGNYVVFPQKIIKQEEES